MSMHKDDGSVIEVETGYERMSGEVKLRDRKVGVEVNYFHGLRDREWAERVFSLLCDALPLLERVSGLPYPRDYGVNIYDAAFEDVGRNDGENREREGIWIKPQAFDSYIVHEAAHCFTDISDESWIMEGSADIYTYIVLQRMNRSRDAGGVKGSAFAEYYKYLKFEEDFPLDGWDPMTAEVKKAYYGYGKAFIFMHMLCKKYGMGAIGEVNRNLHKRGVKASSGDYKLALEGVTGKNTDDLFSGWIFPGEYKVMPDEVKPVGKYRGSDLNRKVLQKVFEKF